MCKSTPIKTPCEYWQCAVIMKHRFGMRYNGMLALLPHQMLHLLLAFAVAQASPLASARQLQALAAGRLPHIHTKASQLCQ